MSSLIKEKLSEALRVRGSPKLGVYVLIQCSPELFWANKVVLLASFSEVICCFLEVVL